MWSTGSNECEYIDNTPSERPKIIFSLKFKLNVTVQYDGVDFFKKN